MGCFPACFGHLRRDLTTNKCLSASIEQHESVKLLPESHKEEEIVNPIKLISQFQDIINEEERVSDHSNVAKDTNEVASSSSSDNKLVENENGQVGKERDEDTLNKDLLMDEKECLAKECSPAVQEESCCSSLFTLSIDSRKHFFAAEMGEKEVSSLLKIKKHEDEKETFPLSKDPMIEQHSFDKLKSKSDRPCRGKDSEMAIETSLSSWLVVSEKSPHKMSVGSSPESENNYGDRQILGVIADIKRLNRVSSTTTSCCSGDDQPGVGTVGCYWQQRGAVEGEGSSFGTRVLGSVEHS